MTRGHVLSALAEDPDLFIEPPEGSRRILTDQYCAVIGPDSRWASVGSLRLPGSVADVERAFVDINERVSTAGRVVWNVGSSATPNNLVNQLHALGLRNPDPPMDPVCAAMVLTDEPDTVAGPQVRRIQTLAEHLAGLEILLSAATWTDTAAADERARAEEVFDRRTRRGGHQWLAWHRDEPVAYAYAERTATGLFLAGGATMPQARGHGCYRALVRARWDEAIRLGLPGLAVQAQYGTSAPILRKLGFTEVAQVHTLQS